MSRPVQCIHRDTAVPACRSVQVVLIQRLRLARDGAIAILLIAIGLATPSASSVADTPAPRKQVWAAPDSGSDGHEQLRAVAAALAKGSVVRIQLESSASHLTRARMLRDGRAQYAATSVAGSVFAQEGLFAFAGHEWGPQPVRAVLMNVQNQLLGIVAAGDAGITTLAELKGKRIARIKDAPEIDQHLRALLAHAGLTWKDVTSVRTEGYAAALREVASGRADVAFAASRTPELQGLASSKRGLVWPLVPHADATGWTLLRQWAPYMVPVDATEGVGLSEKLPVESVSWPYPVVVTLARRNPDDVQAVTGELIARWRDFRGAAPGNAGWEAKRQPLAWAIPWHEGAIRVFRAQGLWRDEHQLHQDRLVERQRVLRQAWDALFKPAQPDTDRDPPDEAAWLKGRAAALQKAGLDTLWNAAAD